MMTRRNSLWLVLVGVAGCTQDDGTSPKVEDFACHVMTSADGTHTLSCPDGSSVTLHDGAMGSQGLMGLPGTEGPQGPMGLPGVDGSQGPMGAVGDGCTVTCDTSTSVSIRCADGTAVLFPVASCETPPLPAAAADLVLVLASAPTSTISKALLIGNDSHVDPTTVTVEPSSACGVALSIVGPDVVYTPSGPSSTCVQLGLDEFAYTVCGSGTPSQCVSATVTVILNRAPTVSNARTCVPAGSFSASLDVASAFADPEGAQLASISLTRVGPVDGVATTAGTVATYIPHTPSLALEYELTIGACDDLSPSACDEAAWSVVWNDPPELASSMGASALPVALSSSTEMPLSSIVLGLGATTFDVGEPIASAEVANTSSGPFGASATTSHGDCVFDSVGAVVRFTSGAVPGVSSCFVRICEACGTTPVCAVAELEFQVGPPD